MAGSLSGARAIVEAITEILKNHIARYMLLIEAELALSPLLPGGQIQPPIQVPDPTHGITASRLFSRDSHCALAVFKADSSTPNQARGLGHPIVVHHLISVTIAWTGDRDTDTEAGLNYLTRAVQAVVLERYTAYYSDACWFDCIVSSIEDGASVRDQNQQLGWDSLGQQGANLTDYAEVSFLCSQRVERNYFITKDLLP